MKPFLKKALRSVGLIKLADSLRFLLMKWKNSPDNRRFKQEYPDIALPPDYLLYEAHQIRYRSYIDYGKTNAARLIAMFEQFLELKGKRILDWGCGPARIVRHLPGLIPGNEIHGCDYNRKSISWNRENIPGVEFSANEINPPLTYDDDYFDAIYGISIFTHLSEENHVNWIAELYRVSKIGAIVIVTTHGDAYREKLTGTEQKLYDQDQVVIQGQTVEGHRTFAAYHPPSWFRNLVKTKFEVLEHLPGKKEHWGYGQDKWILKKAG